MQHYHVHQCFHAVGHGTFMTGVVMGDDKGAFNWIYDCGSKSAKATSLHRLGYTDALCLAAVDDEGYTYNKRVNRLSTIQEHLMLRRAIDRGVSPERIAAALSVDVSHISKKVKLLEGTCDEAAELLKDYTFSANISGYLTKLLGNPAVAEFLQRRQPDVLDEFRSVVEAGGLDS